MTAFTTIEAPEPARSRANLTRLRTLACCVLLGLTACEGGTPGEDGNPPPPPPPDAGVVLESGSLQVSGNAHACEALVEASGGFVQGAEFASGTRGKLVREGDRAGISVISAGSAALPALAATLNFTGTLVVVSTACYGSDGAALAGSGLTL